MDAAARGRLFTVGHSNQSLEEFLDLLRENAIELVIDVRKLPGSKKYPHFDEDALGASLDAAGVGFERVAAFTGRRPVSKTVPIDVNAWWQNRSFHNYADHALGDEFQDALTDLRRRMAEQRVAVMCAEAVWWRCHRRIIADHVIAGGDEALHIMGPGKTVEAELSAGAVVEQASRGSARVVTYPATD